MFRGLGVSGLGPRLKRKEDPCEGYGDFWWKRAVPLLKSTAPPD